MARLPLSYPQFCGETYCTLLHSLSHDSSLPLEAAAAVAERFRIVLRKFLVVPANLHSRL